MNEKWMTAAQIKQLLDIPKKFNIHNCLASFKVEKKREINKEIKFLINHDILEQIRGYYNIKIDKKMKRQGIIEIEPLRRRIGKQEGILLLGSCFADEMGERLAAAGYKVMANRFGTLYNPVSIAQAMQIIGAETFTPMAKEDTELFTYGIGCKRYGSYLFNTKASRESPEEFLSYANSTIEAARHFFKESATIIVTLGTAWVYKHIGKQMIVANCHKVPAKEFSRYRLSIDETLAALKEITAFPGKQYIFTVSPIRHLADGEHGNQLSKATLLLATDALISQAAAPASQAGSDQEGC